MNRPAIKARTTASLVHQVGDSLPIWRCHQLGCHCWAGAGRAELWVALFLAAFVDGGKTPPFAGAPVGPSVIRELSGLLETIKQERLIKSETRHYKDRKVAMEANHNAGSVRDSGVGHHIRVRHKCS